MGWIVHHPSGASAARALHRGTAKHLAGGSLPPVLGWITSKMRYRHVGSLTRRGRVGDWKNLLTTDMVERFDTISQETLEKHGLKF